MESFRIWYENLLPLDLHENFTIGTIYYEVYKNKLYVLR